jgi:hypothetical protein
MPTFNKGALVPVQDIVLPLSIDNSAPRTPYIPQLEPTPASPTHVNQNSDDSPNRFNLSRELKARMVQLDEMIRRQQTEQIDNSDDFTDTISIERDGSPIMQSRKRVESASTTHSNTSLVNSLFQADDTASLDRYMLGLELNEQKNEDNDGCSAMSEHTRRELKSCGSFKSKPPNEMVTITVVLLYFRGASAACTFRMRFHFLCFYIIF